MGTSFLRAAAHDDDQGSNAAITYSLSDQEPAYLHISPSSGWIYVSQPISQVCPRGRAKIPLLLLEEPHPAPPPRPGSSSGLH